MKVRMQDEQSFVGMMEDRFFQELYITNWGGTRRFSEVYTASRKVVENIFSVLKGR